MVTSIPLIRCLCYKTERIRKHCLTLVKDFFGNFKSEQDCLDYHISHKNNSLTLSNTKGGTDLGTLVVPFDSKHSTRYMYYTNKLLMKLKMIPGLSASALTPSPMQMPSGPPMTSAFQMNPPVTSQFQANPSMTSQFQANPPVTSHYQVNQPMTSPFQMTPPPPPHSERSEAVGSDRRDESVMGPPPKSGKNISLLATNKRIPSIFIFNHNLRTIKYN